MFALDEKTRLDAWQMTAHVMQSVNAMLVKIQAEAQAALRRNRR